MDDDFDKLVELLNSSPRENCVIREEFLDDLGITAASLATASGRALYRTFEIHDLSDRNIALRDFVFSFSPKSE